MLVVTSVRGKSAAVFVATARRDNAFPMDAKAQVSFKKFDGQYFLSQVSLPGSDSREVIVTRTHAVQTLAKLNLAGPEHADVAK